MDTLIKADIFFFITTIAVVIITIGISVGIYYVVRTVRKIENYADRIEVEIREKKEEVEDLKDDAKEIIQDIRNSFIYKLLFRKSRNYGKRK